MEKCITCSLLPVFWAWKDDRLFLKSVSYRTLLLSFSPTLWTISVKPQPKFFLRLAFSCCVFESLGLLPKTRLVYGVLGANCWSLCWHSRDLIWYWLTYWQGLKLTWKQLGTTISSNVCRNGFHRPRSFHSCKLCSHWGLNWLELWLGLATAGYSKFKLQFVQLLVPKIFAELYLVWLKPA